MEAKKKVVKKKAVKKVSDSVKVITLRKIGLDDRTSDIGEELDIPREAAIKLQDAGAIKVVL